MSENLKNNNEENTKYTKAGLLTSLEKEIEELEKERNENNQPVEKDELPTGEEDDSEELTAEEQTFRKRYGDLRSHSQKKFNEYEQRILELETQIRTVENSNDFELPTSEEELEEFAKEYPDIYRVIESVALKRNKEVSQEVDSKLEKLQEQAKKIELREAKARLLEYHPDLERINASPIFADWIMVQPEEFKKTLFERNDPEASARLLDLFKRETGWKRLKAADKDNKDTETEQNAALAIKGSAAKEPSSDEKVKEFSESQIQNMTPEQFEKNEKDIREAIQNGRFIYDLSSR